MHVKQERSNSSNKYMVGKKNPTDVKKKLKSAQKWDLRVFF